MFRRKSNLKKVRPRNNKRIFKVFSFLAAIIVVAFGIYLFFSNPFQIKQIGFVTPTYCAPNLELTSFVGSNSQNYFLTDLNGVEKKILERYPCLKTANIKKVFPNKLEVSIEPRERVAQVTVYNSNIKERFRDLEATSSSQTPRMDLVPKAENATESGTFAVDLEGHVFSQEFDPSLTNINIFDENISPGQVVEKDLVKKTMEVLKKLNDEGVSVRKISVRGSSIFIDSEPVIYLSLDKDINRQLISLQLILQKAKIESKRVEKADLRFDKAVVEYSP